MNAAEPKTDPQVLLSRWRFLNDFAGCGSAMLESLARILSSPDTAPDSDIKSLHYWIFDFINCGARLTYNGPVDDLHREVLGPAYGDDPAGWLGQLCDRIFDVIDRLAPWRFGLEREDLVFLDDDELRGQIDSAIRDCREKASSLWPELAEAMQLSDPRT
jgi:hypothetical protein